MREEVRPKRWLEVHLPSHGPLTDVRATEVPGIGPSVVLHFQTQIYVCIY